MTGLIRRAEAWFLGVRDLILLVVVLIVAQPLVPAGSLLARPDLGPWLALSMSLAVLLRGRGLDPGRHPSLRPRHTKMGLLLLRASMATVPWILLLIFDAMRAADLASLPQLGGLCLGAAALRWLSRHEGESAWDPPGPGAIRSWLAGAVVSMVCAAILGLVTLQLRTWVRPQFLVPLLLGLQFYTVGLAGAIPAHLRQRVAAGRRDGKRPSLLPFDAVLALFGPSLGYFVVLLVYAALSSQPVGFAEAWVGALFVAAWAGILWRSPEPVAVGCLLHEVLPEGGADPVPEAQAVGFERPPEGALRFDPLRLKRSRSLHPWIVPVRSARITAFDDPIQPLWPPATPIPAAHVLGMASFDPDPLTGGVQTEVLTLHLGARSDTALLSDEDAQARRIVVLRPFPRLGGRTRDARATYLWDAAVHAEGIQVIDATADRVELIHGDVIVVSAEGVARAYELEVGAPLLPSNPLSLRPPQLQDYAEAQ